MGEGYLSSPEPLNNSIANIFHQYFQNSMNRKVKGLKGKIDMVIRGSNPSTMVHSELASNPLGSDQFCSQIFLGGVDIILGYF